LEFPTERRSQSDLTWPPPDLEIEAVQVIELSPRDSSSSHVMSAHVIRFPERRPRPYLVVSSYRSAPPWLRPRERRYPRLWPIAIGLLILELVESRARPSADPLEAAPSPPAAIASATPGEPAASAMPPIATQPARPASDASSERRVATRRESRARREAEIEREPVRRVPPAVASRAAARPPAPEPQPAETLAVAAPEPTLLPAASQEYVPPRPEKLNAIRRGPAPFPAARGSRTRLEVVVDVRGRVESARLLTSDTPYYDQRALAAVRTWRFEPARLDGRPVRASLDVDVRAP
jgi:periplasmic protein TonB